MKKLITSTLPFVILFALSGCSKSLTSTETIKTPIKKPVVSDTTIKEVDDSLTIPEKIGILPLKSDRIFTTIKIEENSEVKNLNYHKDQITNDISINGFKVILKKDDGLGLYRSINSKENIANLTINAEELEVHDPILLRQTNIIIKAKSIKFIGKGKFITTPVTISTASTKTNALDGLKAGDINVYADIITLEDVTGPVFILNAGHGQSAKPGRNGHNGSNADLVGNGDYHSLVTTSCFIRDRPDPREFDRFKSTKAVSSKCKKTTEDGRSSSDGGNAIAGGNPGEPGVPGQLNISNNTQTVFNTNGHLTELYHAMGGNAGRHGGDFVGGQPGTPVKTCELYLQVEHGPGASDAVSRNVKHCKDAAVGASITSPRATIEHSSNIDMQTINGSWYSVGYVELQLYYANLAFEKNYFHEAKLIMDSIEENLLQIDNEDIAKLSQEVSKTKKEFIDSEFVYIDK